MKGETVNEQWQGSSPSMSQRLIFRLGIEHPIIPLGFDAKDLKIAAFEPHRKASLVKCMALFVHAYLLLSLIRDP
jgi:hypothetical protein